MRQGVELLLQHHYHANQHKFLDVPVVAGPYVPWPGSEDKAPTTPEPVALTEWLAGLVIRDDYVVERVLGEGAMGKVYLVRSKSTGLQHAVKRAKLRDEASRRNFLAELQTWIDLSHRLPDHPNLVACRFFQTVGDEIAIFAEFVDGGSLEMLIKQRRLTLEQILDAAIQFAWGLHAAHELGLVHQDVKPGNALVTSDGLVKVADFGLARARALTQEQDAGAAGQSILVSCRGWTTAYRSPEQKQVRPLSRKTDIWSWGVSVWEMFTGALPCERGEEAAEALEAYLQRPAGPNPPVMPNDVAEVAPEVLPPRPGRALAEPGRGCGGFATRLSASGRQGLSTADTGGL